MISKAEKIKQMHKKPGLIVSKPASEEYRENYERIFKGKEKE